MFEETFVGADGVLQARLNDDLSFSLVFRRDGEILVEYSSARAYDFKSVEKLRYDFERDVEKALAQA
jgi:hypothetical protein